jgi:hypothetical protein
MCTDVYVVPCSVASCLWFLQIKIERLPSHKQMSLIFHSQHVSTQIRLHPVYSDRLKVCTILYLLFEALLYKPESRGFDSRWCHWIFNWPNPSSRTMTLRSTQYLTEKITRNLPGGKWRPVRRVTTSLPSVSRLSIKCGNFDVSNPMGHHDLLQS